MPEHQRYTLELKKKIIKQIDRIVKKEGIKTRADIVRNALRLYIFCYEEREQGKKIIIEQGRKRKEIIFGGKNEIRHGINY